MLDLMALADKWDGAICQDNDIDPEMFFDNNRVAEAAEVCEVCPLRLQCLRYAMEDENLLGVWGGTTEKERSKLRATIKKTGRAGIANKIR